MTDPQMYNVASAVLCRSLAIVRSHPLPGCELGVKKKDKMLGKSRILSLFPNSINILFSSHTVNSESFASFFFLNISLK